MKWAAVTLLVMGLSGCGSAVNSEYNSANLGDQTPQQQWANLSPQNYVYTAQRSCFCTSEYTRQIRVVVSKGSVVSATYLDSGTMVSAQVLKSLRTVDQWFAYIRKGQEKPFHQLEVSYDPKLGYPTRIYGDINARIADDEQTVTLSDLAIQ
ncbi:hypothetical protein KFE80_06505 [bacterium SCSIO 12696]|nr:hypothetical protein KFE80_06505 [bacterium SCSIO 12696]